MRVFLSSITDGSLERGRHGGGWPVQLPRLGAGTGALMCLVAEPYFRGAEALATDIVATLSTLR
jgi:hypothetical protein